ncbi:MAG: cell division protein ZapA [Kiritimatiellia bacterium]
MTSETVSVDILGKDYQVACPSDEREALIQAAAELDRRMTVIRQSGSVIGVERIAVMAALNLAHEVLDPARTEDANKSVFEKKLIGNMCQRVDALLAT